MICGVGLVLRLAQPFPRKLNLALGGQGNSAGGAAFDADFTAREAAKWMRHDGITRPGVPFKDIVRTEIEALKVRAAGVVVNGGKPREFLAKITQQGHSTFLQVSHE